MGKNTNETHNISGWFQTVKAEFNKISWPSRETLGKETSVVVVSSVVLGVVIAILDMVLRYGIQLLIK